MPYLARSPFSFIMDPEIIRELNTIANATDVRYNMYNASYTMEHMRVGTINIGGIESADFNSWYDRHEEMTTNHPTIEEYAPFVGRGINPNSFRTLNAKLYRVDAYPDYLQDRIWDKIDEPNGFNMDDDVIGRDDVDPWEAQTFDPTADDFDEAAAYAHLEAPTEEMSDDDDDDVTIAREDDDILIPISPICVTEIETGETISSDVYTLAIDLTGHEDN
jgi:hypothetical protein